MGCACRLAKAVEGRRSGAARGNLFPIVEVALQNSARSSVSNLVLSVTTSAASTQVLDGQVLLHDHAVIREVGPLC